MAGWLDGIGGWVDGRLNSAPGVDSCYKPAKMCVVQISGTLLPR
jgi:hypothetical protein